MKATEIREGILPGHFWILALISQLHLCTLSEALLRGAGGLRGYLHFHADAAQDREGDEMDLDEFL